MHKTDAPGATITNEFTEGNPSLSIPATEVGSKWLNTIQRELVAVVEGAGLTLNDLDDDQLKEAIEIMIGLGGATVANFTVANNQSIAANVTGLLFNKVTYKGARIPFDLMRSTASSNFTESGVIYVSHNSFTDTWQISVDSKIDDAGVTFSINSSGQVQYTSTNIAGGSYSGVLRIAGITRFKQ